MACVFKYIPYILLAAILFKPSLPTEVANNICQCAVFKAGADPLNSEPLFVRNTEIEMAASDEGRKECSDLCAALAEAAKADGPKVLCGVVKDDIDNLFVTIFSQLVGNPWTNTGKNSTEPICCKNHLSVTCNEAFKM